MQIVLLEDVERGRFGPLTALRPDFELRCGALLLREKIELRRPDWTVVLCPRPELAPLVGEMHQGRGLDALDEGPAFLLYGTIVADDALLRQLESVDRECLLVSEGRPVGARLDSDVSSRITSSGAAAAGLGALELPSSTEIEATTVVLPWELVDATPGQIGADAELWKLRSTASGVADDGTHLVGDDILLGEGSVVRAGAVLDSTNGPVLIGRDVVVMPNAFIEGPAAVGDGSLIRVGAAVSGGTSIGPVCKIGGEIQGSVVHSFSNKQHGGFLGHSYVGSWVNLGAATDNSDLKNNYGPVTVRLGGEVFETGLRSVGAFIGDHTKTAIGTKLNTGTVIGIFCNVVSVGFPPKSIPDFSWSKKGGFVRQSLERALETASVVMKRRGRELTPALEALIEALFEPSA